MPENRLLSLGDDMPVTGGVELPSQMVATPDTSDDCAPDDDLGRQVYWLLKLHPNAVSLKFRQSDLFSMDDDTKRLLIADIQNSLGVSPLIWDVL